MQFAKNQAPPQDGGGAKTFPRTDEDGYNWVLHGPYTKKPYRVFEPGEDIKSSRKFRAATDEEARQAFGPKPPTENRRPPILDMTEEELAASADYDFTANEPEQEQPETPPRQEQPQPKPNQYQAILQRLLDKEQALGNAATQRVVFSPPVISRHEVGIMGRGTVNVIQGPFGSHKSRLAELLAALMLTTTNDTTAPQFLEFKRAMLERFCVCYIDTERNQKEELPFAVQGIKLRAGYRLDDKPEHFRFTSIKGEKREDRFRAIETFIQHVRDQSTLHLFCLIDVVTDAIGDFNDPKESMKLFDFLGNLCDNYDATFLLVIHQNPGTEKARGHTGTEAANKASTVLQIGLEKDANGNDTDLIKLRYLKLRRGKKPEPLYLQFCKESNGLQLAGADALTSHNNQRRQKADVEDVADRLTSLLAEGPLPKGDVVKTLESDFGVANATVRDRLKQVVEEPPLMTNEKGQVVRLGEYRDGRQQYYRLEPVEG